jgi:hypothetical protein
MPIYGAYTMDYNYANGKFEPKTIKTTINATPLSLEDIAKSSCTEMEMPFMKEDGNIEMHKQCWIMPGNIIKNMAEWAVVKTGFLNTVKNFFKNTWDDITKGLFGNQVWLAEGITKEMTIAELASKNINNIARGIKTPINVEVHIEQNFVRHVLNDPAKKLENLKLGEIIDLLGRSDATIYLAPNKKYVSIVKTLQDTTKPYHILVYAEDGRLISTYLASEADLTARVIEPRYVKVYGE